jgi:hypothetical protein
VVTAYVEPSLASGKGDEKFQFERHGYFAAGTKDDFPLPPNGGEGKWAAAGFIDTLLRWKMKLEVVHGNEKAIQPGVQA